jgi:hypothetical protein
MAGLESATRQLFAQGLSFRQIADRLLEDHGCKVSYAAVKRFVDEETEERRTAARSVAAEDAKESVPLVTGALRTIVVMNLKAAQISYLGKERGGTEKDPKPDVQSLARASNAATNAAKVLHAVTMGDNPTDAMSTLRDDVTRIVAEKHKREEMLEQGIEPTFH